MKWLTAIVFMFTIQFISGCSDVYDARVSWEKPLSGSEPDHYVVELNIGLEKKSIKTTSEFLNVKLPYGESCFARIAAVDALSRQGEFSQPSDPILVPKPTK